MFLVSKDFLEKQREKFKQRQEAERKEKTKQGKRLLFHSIKSAMNNRHYWRFFFISTCNV